MNQGIKDEIKDQGQWLHVLESNKLVWLSDQLVFRFGLQSRSKVKTK